MILPVYFEEHLVGEIYEDAAGPRFVYAVSWINDRHAFPISTTMPLDGHEVEPARFLTWASNLLPEAEQLAVISRRLGVAQTDVLALLEAIGRDTAGALSFGARGLTGMERWRPVGSDDDLERIIEELPGKPFRPSENSPRADSGAAFAEGSQNPLPFSTFTLLWCPNGLFSGHIRRRDDRYGRADQACTAWIIPGTPMRVMARLIL